MVDWKKVFKFLLFFALGSLILYLVYYKSNQAFIEDCQLKGVPEDQCSLIGKVKNDFISSNKWIVTLSVLCFVLSNGIRAIRWKQLLAPLGYKPRFLNSFGAVNIGYLLNLSFPRAGEVARPAVLAKYENVSFEHAIGTVVTERIVDFFCLFLVLIIGLVVAGGTLIEYAETNMNISEKFEFLVDNKLLLGFMISLIGVLIYMIKRNFAKLKNSNLGKRIIDFVHGLFQGIKSIRQVDNPFLFLIYSLSIWLLYYLMTYFMFYALTSTSSLSAIAALVVYIFGSMGMVFPSPGGMGSYHFMIEQALLIYGISISDAFSFANLMFFSVQIFGVVLFGILAYIYLPLINKKS